MHQLTKLYIQKKFLYTRRAKWRGVVRPSCFPPFVVETPAELSTYLARGNDLSLANDDLTLVADSPDLYDHILYCKETMQRQITLLKETCL